MTAIFHDSDLSDDRRREQLYGGDIFVFTPRPSTIALIEHARAMIEETFGEDPGTAQYCMPVEEFSALGAALKPRFIHHARTKRLIRRVIADHGCDLRDTYLDVPRMRLATAGGYLTAGVGYAFHPHRDTWYSAPMCQLNWWMPIYNFTSDSGMAFHSRYMHQAIKNGSAEFNYYRWNADGRKNSGQHVKTDMRRQPRPEEPIELDPQIRPVCKAGGVILFSAAHLHSTVPNTSDRTRFSIDFRTVHYVDLEDRRSPPNLDSHCSGTSLRDFLRGEDLKPLPVALIDAYDSGQLADGVLVFKPEIHDAVRAKT